MGHKVAVLAFPPGPVVVDIGAPEVEPSVDSGCCELIAQNPERADAFVLPSTCAGAEEEFAFVVEFHPGVVVAHSADEMNGGIGVERAVHIVAEEVLRVVDS